MNEERWMLTSNGQLADKTDKIMVLTIRENTLGREKGTVDLIHDSNSVCIHQDKHGMKARVGCFHESILLS